MFSSTTGFVNFITTQGSYNGTPPNFLCTGPVGGSIDCAHETILDFSTPVSGLTFQGMGIDDVSASVAQVDVYVSGVLNSTVTVSGNAEGLNPRLVDLSAFSNVTRIRIFNITDGGGIGWDTFIFTQGAAGVPEPSTMVSMGIGLLGVIVAYRRRARVQ